MKKVITDAQFTKMLCEVLKNEEPEVVINLIDKAGIIIPGELNVMDLVKAIRNLK